MTKQSMWANQIFKNMFSNVAVHSTQRIIQIVHICVMINCPCEVYPLFLPSTEVNTLQQIKFLSQRIQNIIMYVLNTFYNRTRE